MLSRYFGGVCLALVAAGSGAEQYCREYRVETTPDNAFVVHTDGTVTHLETGLMWMRCSLGQTWEGDSCSGYASKHNWSDAMGLGYSERFASYNNWRLPEKDELTSILEKRCETPMINAKVFPDTPSNWYWTASMPGLEDDSHLAWYVSFGLGRVHNQQKNHHNRVRLVRTIKSAD